MNARKLPPLILHPFADAGGPEKLVESSRASLVLQGLLPAGDRNTQDVERTLLEGRFCEIRMLFYVGKDLLRWIEQCLELVERTPEFCGTGIKYQSFAAYLVGHTPEAVQAKLKKWGVSDYRAIFSRAIGIHSLFEDPPPAATLSPIFLKNYHRYADHAYICYQHSQAFLQIDPNSFLFEIYASEEYSRILSDGWDLP